MLPLSTSTSGRGLILCFERKSRRVPGHITAPCSVYIQNNNAPADTARFMSIQIDSTRSYLLYLLMQH